MTTRRGFVYRGLQLGLAAATAPLWSSILGRRAFAQSATSTYKAVLVITLAGGNDGNNLLIPLDPTDYAEYRALRSILALPASQCLPLTTGSGSATYGLNPVLSNVAQLFNQKRASIVANVGPLAVPVTKQQLIAHPASYPESLLSHPAGQQQWESATTLTAPTTGWGGRIADQISTMSGSLPPVLNTAANSIFTVGASVQGIAVQSGGAYAAIPPAMNATILQIAQNDAKSTNNLVSQVAAFRVSAMRQQVILNQAMSYGTVKRQFTSTPLGKSMQTIAELLAGRSVVGASRQIFYTQQIGYDTHQDQLQGQSLLLSDLDANVGSFFGALDDLGLSNNVLVCTHSDFCRTLAGNSNGGSDHAWGNHQLVLGGGVNGGRIIGTMPTLELGGPDDFTHQGVWIPTLSVTQMTASIGSWLGLNSTQLAQVFPELVNFPDGPIALS